jgi:hypothetical protein
MKPITFAITLLRYFLFYFFAFLDHPLYPPRGNFIGIVLFQTKYAPSSGEEGVGGGHEILNALGIFRLQLLQGRVGFKNGIYTQDTKNIFHIFVGAHDQDFSV